MEKLYNLISVLISIGVGSFVGLLLMVPVFPLLTDAGWHPREADSLTKLILYGVGVLGIPMTIFGFLGFKYLEHIVELYLRYFHGREVAYEVKLEAGETPEDMKAIRKKAIVGTMNENSSVRVITRPTPANPKQIGEAKAWHTNDLNWRRWIAIPLIVLVIIGFSGFFVGQKTQSTNAADPADLQQLKDIGVCVRCDLRGASLKGAILCNTTMPDGSVIYSGC